VVIVLPSSSPLSGSKVGFPKWLLCCPRVLLGLKVVYRTHLLGSSYRKAVVKALEEDHNAKDAVWDMRSPGLLCTIHLSEMLERRGMEVEISRVQKCSNIVKVYFSTHGTADAVDQLCLSALATM
jgi:hypothetical protein